jgi:magnesium chelatase subunit D
LEDTNADSSSSNHNESKDHQDIQETAMPLEMILDAIKSNLSPEALKALIDKTKISSLRQNTSGFGQKKYSNRRGRPLPSRVGSLDSGKRLDIIETLKAAAPWQTIRRTGASLDQFKVLIRKSDLRVKRYEEKSDRLIIFTVDASGTSALGRLGETKGAIEILLSEAYARRDQVALISFRGEQATLELPPTRSLVQTKRRLAGLPGGGTTPLAAALSESYKLAIQARSKGMTPTLALLTDGKGNIALDGSADRKTAETDMGNLAALIRSAHIPSIVVDTSRRPQMPAQSLSQNLSATYIALPYADSKKLYSAVSKVIT